MNLIFDTYKKTGNLHHAYLIEGEREVVLKELTNFLELEVKFKIHGNPDFWYGEFDTLGIDDGRVLQERQIRKSLGGKKIFVISTNFITREAQNSLLKVFEEPTTETHFFILTPSAESLLPTLKSRLVIIKSSPANMKMGGDKIAVEFLGKNGAERIELLGEIIENKEKGQAIDFLNNLEKVLRDRSPQKKYTPEEIFVFDEIIKCRSYLHDRAPSVKMILEYLSLIIPFKK